MTEHDSTPPANHRGAPGEKTTPIRPTPRGGGGQEEKTTPVTPTPRGAPGEKTTPIRPTPRGGGREEMTTPVTPTPRPEPFGDDGPTREISDAFFAPPPPAPVPESANPRDAGGQDPWWHVRRHHGPDSRGPAFEEVGPVVAQPGPAAQTPMPESRPGEIPWYQVPPDRPAQPLAPPPAPDEVSPVRRRGGLRRWILPVVGVLVVAAAVGGALLVAAGLRSPTDASQLDVAQTEADVAHVLTDPVDGYGAQYVSGVRCNDGRNPAANKGASFTCTGTVNGKQRRINVVVVDDQGTFEVDWPR